MKSGQVLKKFGGRSYLSVIDHQHGLEAHATTDVQKISG
jgi:hypothetical protein